MSATPTVADTTHWSAVGVWRLPLPFTQVLCNLNRARGRHWAVEQRDKDTLITAAWAVAKQYRVPPLDRATVELEFRPGTNRAQDADNMGLMLKHLIDGLRQAGVFPDDRGRHVLATTCRLVEAADDDRPHKTPAMFLVITRQDR